jgi:hypothetical protein
MPRAASGATHAARIQGGGYAVQCGDPGGSNLPHDRQDIQGEAIGARLMWKSSKPYQSRKSAALVA